jgi:iron complex transport system substrate-binding protein
MNKSLFFWSFACLLLSCKQQSAIGNYTKNSDCQYAEGLKIKAFYNYHQVILTNIFDEQKEDYVYILHKKGAKIPDSLEAYPQIEVPINRLVASSSTHIPPLELLGTENTLVGFPHLDYISSPKTRARIKQNLIVDIGQNNVLNMEKILLLKPDLVMGFGVNEASKDFEFLQNKKIPVIFNGEWRETHPLGKAEWLKLFGLLYDQKEKADSIYSKIVTSYNQLKTEAQLFSFAPKVMSGGVFENVWYAPKGESWGAKLIADAGGNYLWKDEKGQGSINLSFEEVLLKAKDADVWIGPSGFDSYLAMLAENTNYKHFKAFQERKVYSYTMKKGETGAVLYFETGVYEPHLLLKDLIAIFHQKPLNLNSLQYLSPLDE